MLRSPLPPDLDDCFTVAEARDAGVSASRLRASDLFRPFHGLRAHRAGSDGDGGTRKRAEEVLLTRALHYARRMTPHEFFSHVAAAVLWDLPLPGAVLRARALDVTVLMPRRAPAGKGVAGHVVAPGLAYPVIHPVHGVRVTSPASTWAMLGAVLPDLRDLVAVGDAVAREPLHPGDPPGLATIEELHAAVAAGRRRGRPALRAALEVVDTRSRSRPETWLRLILTRAGLTGPVVNFDVVVRGEWLGQVDLAYPGLRIALEYEGAQHLTDPVQWAKDIRRYDRLAELGWRVIRVTKSEVFADPTELIQRVRRAIAQASR